MVHLILISVVSLKNSSIKKNYKKYLSEYFVYVFPHVKCDTCQKLRILNFSTRICELQFIQRLYNFIL